MSSTIQISIAKPEDALKLLHIYTYYILHTAITCECHLPSVEDFYTRIQQTLVAYPYLIIKQKDEILGFAYTSPFNKREACQWAVETSIYLKPNLQQRGLGTLLYEKIEQISRAQNITYLNACLTYTDQEDKRLPKTSYYFHLHRGFKQVAHFHDHAYKFHDWYDIIWMEKMIATPTTPPTPFIPFNKLDPTVIDALLMSK